MPLNLTLGTIFYFSLLLINAVAILHEERFLAKVGLSSSAFMDPNSMQARAANLIGSIRTLLRIPLILLNILVILYELALGDL
ncbi:Yos1-like protein [Gorgonomyces haynaldii]|nr:Yos1-like protein [Gorgonomyces haynaldii]